MHSYSAGCMTCAVCSTVSANYGIYFKLMVNVMVNVWLNLLKLSYNMLSYELNWNRLWWWLLRVLSVMKVAFSFDILCLHITRSIIIDEVIKDYCQKKDIRNFAKRTKVSYRGELKKHLKFCDSLQVLPSSKSFKSFLSELINHKKLSECSLKTINRCC